MAGEAHQRLVSDRALLFISFDQLADIRWPDAPDHAPCKWGKWGVSARSVSEARSLHLTAMSEGAKRDFSVSMQLLK